MLSACVLSSICGMLEIKDQLCPETSLSKRFVKITQEKSRVYGITFECKNEQFC